MSVPALPPPFEVGPTPPGDDDVRVGFRARLLALDRDLTVLADDVAAAIGPVNRAFLTGDRDLVADETQRHLALAARCRELEDAGFVIIAREAPVAVDLRWIVAIMRAIVDVERSSKLLVHVAESVADVHVDALRSTARWVSERLADSSRRIFVSGVRAWRQRDGLAVHELDGSDDEVDRLQEGLIAELSVGGHRVEDVVTLALVGRYYERLADHGVALAQHVAWAITGDRPGARWQGR